MNLYFFNFSHELAMANGRTNYVPPGHVRMMERDLMPLAAWFAGIGDGVIVYSSKLDVCRRFYASLLPEITFCSLANLPTRFSFVPWGWDFHAVWQMYKAGFDDLPSDDMIAAVHRLSSRAVACRVLNRIVNMLPGLPLCGEAHFCTTTAAVDEAVTAYSSSILKAQLSGSGRGLRFCGDRLIPPLIGWCKNTIKTQGGVVVEPFFDKLTDFAAEFEALPSGEVRFKGFSLFHTKARCSYVSNTVASQINLKQLLFSDFEEEVFYLTLPSLQSLLEEEIKGDYVGPLGVDMMICRSRDGIFKRLHPCVEINMRNTMGMVALRLTRLLPESVVSRFFIHYEKRPSDLKCFIEALPPPGFDGEGRLICGVLPLTPVDEITQYVAYLQV